MIKEIISRIKFWKATDRIGPDVPWYYWKLFFRSTMLKYCTSKFLYFDPTAEIRPGCFIVGCSQISIGKRVVIRPGSMIHGETSTLKLSILIEDDVLIGSGVHIYIENHKFEGPDPSISIIDMGHTQAKQVTLKKGCWIGANAVILPGVTIGKNSVIGAGSIVTKSIPDHCVAAGNPAKIIKRIIE
ncbi:acyltransferase [Aquimarina macrocephali]|uniref:acyltransferase n=1 Tax=Aquimarina macrocephali TaxID=666563 RepID=UPI003F6616E2